MKITLVILAMLVSASAFSATKFVSKLDCAIEDTEHLVLAGGIDAYCKENGKDEYFKFQLAGVGLGLSGSKGAFTITIISLNPFGDIEGKYFGGDVSVGSTVGLHGGVLVGEFGAKWVILTDLMKGSRDDRAGRVNAHVRLDGLFIYRFDYDVPEYAKQLLGDVPADK